MGTAVERAAIAICAVSVFQFAVARAEPNQVNPAAPLSTHNTMAAAADLASKGYALVADAEQTLDQAERWIASGKPERISAQAVGQAAVKTAQAERLGLQLVDMGEPAGIDIHLRLVKVRERTLKVVNAYRATPPGSQLLQKLHLQMVRGKAAREQVAQKIEQQAATDVARAEKNLYTALDSLHAAAVFDPARGQMSMYTPFAQAQQMVAPAMARARREQTTQRCAKLLADVEPETFGWLIEAAAAAQSIQQSGQAPINGNLVSGPQAVQAYGEQWGVSHAQLMQASALQMITATTPQTTLDLERRLASQAGQVLAQIIQSDTQHTAPEAAGEKYDQYLRALAPLVRRTTGSTIRDACADPLTRLAEKASLQSDIETYRQATGELLRWRKRLADKQLAPALEAFVTLPRLTRQAFQSRPDYVGLYPQAGTGGRGGPATASLRGSAMDTLEPALSEVIGSAVIAENLLRISPNSRSAIATYQDRTYANLPVPRGLEPSVAALKSDLLIDDSHPPLTLHTASAIQAAEWGEFAMAGGKVSNVHLEGLVTRLRTLPEAAAIFSPRGRLPETEALSQHNYLDQIVVRYDVVPTWVRHEYFVATIPNSNPSIESP